jgi:biopolymer transport protein TolR
MHKANPELPVMISADREIKYDEVIQVISEAKKIGINRVGLATKQ